MVTLVIGASTNPARYSFRAIHSLLSHGIEVRAFGLRSGKVGSVDIITEKSQVSKEGLDTITLYVGPGRQSEELKEWILSLAPRRVIFNPGTENPGFEQELFEAGIYVQRACTLVMLNVGNYEMV